MCHWDFAGGLCCARPPTGGLLALHTITATIVNAHAEYVIINMRSAAFATRGKADVELAW